MWIHDLRRTLGSWLTESGSTIQLIAKVLNHKNIATTAVYVRLTIDPIRKALQENANRILEVSGYENPEQMLEFDSDYLKKLIPLIPAQT